MRDGVFGTGLTRRRFVGQAAGLGLGTLAGPTAFSPWAFAAEPLKPKTVENGVITIAMSGAMPGTGMKDGSVMGTDADMVTAIAKHLGLGVKPPSWPGRRPSKP